MKRKAERPSAAAPSSQPRQKTCFAEARAGTAWHSVQACNPSAVRGGGFSLLCFQPKALPLALSAPVPFLPEGPQRPTAYSLWTSSLHGGDASAPRGHNNPRAPLPLSLQAGATRPRKRTM